MPLFIFLFCSVGSVVCVNDHPFVDTIPLHTDSLLLLLIEQQQSLESEAIVMNEQERSMTPATSHASPLYAEKDIFHQIAGFQFSTFRFRPRGYESSFTTVLINGLNMNQPDDGSPAWSLWSGLQSVMKNSVEYMPVRFQEHWLGYAGNVVYTDMRAISQKPQFQFLYSNANRNYSHRYQLSYTTIPNNRGWIFSGAITLRSAKEGWNIGTSFYGAGYYLAVDKQLLNNQLLSFVLFGNDQQSGKQAAITIPVMKLFGNRYNPNWGYQHGVKRNATVVSQYRPVLMFMHEWQPNNHSSWRSSIGISTGKKADMGLDWFQAADPRPDYYRYLPEYQTDSSLREQVSTILTEDISLQQINWQKLYEINRNSYDQIDNADGISGNSISGKRARYLLEKRIKDVQGVLFGSNYQNRLSEQWQIAAGIHFRFQSNHHYKVIEDLLGADFHVNHNQFAETDLPTDQSIIQYNLDKSNQVLYEGDKYGYDYKMIYTVTDGWMQSEKKGERVDLTVGLHLSKQTFFRRGLVRNGLFPNQSKGDSKTEHLFNAVSKIVVIQKITPRQSILYSLTMGSKAPLAENVYLSPRMRDTKQDSVKSEKLMLAECMYRVVAKKLHFRISAYWTKILEGMNVLTFYHDGYRNFVNYSISNIDREHIGIEAGLGYLLNEHWQLNFAASAGNYRYISRQRVTVSLDNNEFLLDKMDIYSKNYRVGGSPQLVVGSAIQYRNSQALFAQINWNYLDQRWLEFNPVRRTYNAMQGVSYGSDLWKEIIQQKKLPSVITVNLFLGKGFSLKAIRKGKSILYFCSLSIQNLLNKKGMIAGGYEQLRFDQETKDVNRFPAKLFFSPGLNYAASISMTL